MDVQGLTRWVIRSSQQLLVRSYGLTTGILGGFFSVILALFLSGYMLADSRTLIKNLVRLLPQPWDDRLAAQVGPMSNRIGSYIRGRLLVSTILAVSPPGHQSLPTNETCGRHCSFAGSGPSLVGTRRESWHGERYSARADRNRRRECKRDTSASDQCVMTDRGCRVDEDPCGTSACPLMLTLSWPWLPFSMRLS